MARPSNPLRLAEEALLKVRELDESGYRNRQQRFEALQAARALVLELEDEDDSMYRRLEQSMAAQSLSFMMQLHVHKHIPVEGSIPASELAKAVGADTALIIKHMRLLVAVGDFKETAPNTYAHGKAQSLLEPAREYFHRGFLSGHVTNVVARLPEYYKDHPLVVPTSASNNPTTWSVGMEGHSVWSMLAKLPDFIHGFNMIMAANWHLIPFLGYYPFDDRLKELSDTCAGTEQDRRVFIVDIGGGLGASMKELRLAYPELKGKIVVQDLERGFIGMQEHPSPKDLDIHHMEHDFFQEQPIKGAAVYHLRRILHDWNDEVSATILRHVTEAMDEDSKILVTEIALSEMVTVGDSHPYFSDVMMSDFGGTERTEAEFTRLFEKCGLSVTGVWKAKEGSHAVIEGQRRSSSMST